MERDESGRVEGWRGMKVDGWKDGGMRVDGWKDGEG